MTFSEICLAVQDRLNLTSSSSLDRIGREVNDRHRRITSSLGINVTRRITTYATTTIGQTTLTFTGIEKIVNIIDRTNSPYRYLKEITIEELRNAQPSSNTFCSFYCIVGTTWNSVTVEMDCVPAIAFPLYADCLQNCTVLSGSMEPIFPESFHDILFHGALEDEYLKLEKVKLAQDSGIKYAQRLSDLRMWLAKSSSLDIVQGKTRGTFLDVAGVPGAGGEPGGNTSQGITIYYNVTATPYGVIPNSGQNATAGIQSAINAAVSSGGVVYLPAGKYIVTPPSSGGPILSIPGPNIRIMGDGPGLTVIQVAAGAPPYSAIIGAGNNNASHLEVDHLTFDHNIGSNPIPSLASINANPENTIQVFNGNSIRYHYLEIINASSINNLVVNGANITNVFISDCVFSNVGNDPNGVVHDSSLIYVAGLSECTISNIQITTAGQNTPGTAAGIETHISQCIIENNTILNCEIGMNVTGVAAQETDDVTISGNTITGGLIGIVLYSVPFTGHTTGFGLKNVIVANNVINLVSVASWPNGSEEGGIIIATNTSELPVSGMIIANNIIRYPLEAVNTVAHNTASLGIGWYSNTNQMLFNSKIADNIIINFPMSAIRLSCGVQDVDITGNFILDGGSTLYTGFANTLAYRIPFFLGSASNPVINLTIKKNIFIDNIAGSTRPAYFMYLAQSPTSSGVEIVDNSFFSNGSSMVQQILLDSSAGALSPYLKGSISGFTTTNAGKWALGSSIIDPSTGLNYTIRPDQITWQSGLLSSNVAPIGGFRYQSFGSSLVAGDFVLSAGWGIGATIAVAGSDQGFVVNITAGSSPSANPTTTLTFHDGAWPFLPVANVQLTGVTGALPSPFIIGVSCSPTTLAWSAIFTPTATVIYQFTGIVIGKPN